MGTRSTAPRAERAARAMRAVRIAIVAASLVAFPGSSALAQPPGNDDRGDARAVESVPYQDRVDTTEATRQAIDPCTSEEEAFRTVWYSFTPAQAARFAARADGDDEYPTILAVAIPAGSGDLEVLDCTWGDTIVWQAQAGQEYLLMAGTWSDARSGMLDFAILRPPRDPWVRVSVADGGRVGPLGAAIVSGRVRCPPRVGGAWVSVRVRQEFWRFIVIGSGDTNVGCGDRWTARVRSPVFTFAPGEATVRAIAMVCDEYGCARRGTGRTVTLR